MNSLTPEVVSSQEQRAEQAFQINQAVHQCVRNIESNFYQLASLLFVMRKDKLYKELGYETFQAYVASLDTSFSFRHLQIGIQLVRCVLNNSEFRNRLEPKLGIALEKLSPTKLVAVLPAVNRLLEQNDEAKALELLAATRPVDDGGLSRTDLFRLLEDEGFKTVSIKRYLCITRPAEVCMVETDAYEDLLARYDLVIEEPRVIKGATQLET